jgi:hypothetical protein
MRIASYRRVQRSLPPPRRTHTQLWIFVNFLSIFKLRRTFCRHNRPATLDRVAAMCVFPTVNGTGWQRTGAARLYLSYTYARTLGVMVVVVGLESAVFVGVVTGAVVYCASVFVWF